MTVNWPGGSILPIPCCFHVVAQQIAPALIVIALGVNDAQTFYRTEFSSAYGLLLRSLLKVSKALVTTTPTDDPARFNPLTVESINDIISDHAKLGGSELIDIAPLPFATIDGVHLTKEASGVWVRAISDGIRSSLKCR
jgi:lysophospholipase L1-like esterase